MNLASSFIEQRDAFRPSRRDTLLLVTRGRGWKWKNENGERERESVAIMDELTSDNIFPTLSLGCLWSR